MEAIRGKFAKSFRSARKVYSTSKKNWYFGFLLEMIINSDGKISHISVGTEAEARQLQNLLEDFLECFWVFKDKTRT